MNLRTELAQLPASARAEVRVLEGKFKRLSARKPGTVRALHRIARAHSTSFGTVRRKFYLWKRTGLAGIIDRRRLGNNSHGKKTLAAAVLTRERLGLAWAAVGQQSSFNAIARALQAQMAGRVNVHGLKATRTGLPRGLSLSSLHRAAREIVIFRGRHAGRAFEVTAAGTLKPQPVASYPCPARKTSAGSKALSGMANATKRSTAANRGVGA